MADTKENLRGRKAERRIRTGDTVEVIAGSSKGDKGKVLRLNRGKDRAVVQNINLRWKHLRRSQEAPQGGRLQREQPIHVSNLRRVSSEDAGE